MTLTLAFSPCPNDCFMFDAIVNRRIDLEGLEFDVRLADVEALNKAAFAGDVDVTKLSYHAYAYCAGDYVLLDAGSALGRNCGPLLISKRAIPEAEVGSGALRIAIPGKYTTANFLLGLAFPGASNRTELLFSDIEGAVLDGRVDAGLIIHENRFTYAAKGLEEDRGPRRILGSGDGRADSSRWHRRSPFIAGRREAGGQSRRSSKRGVCVRAPWRKPAVCSRACPGNERGRSCTSTSTSM